MPTNKEKLKMTIDEIIADIDRISQSGGMVKVFTDGYCYDFAYMLQRIFGGDIVYNMQDHYLLHVNNKFYDITGEVEAPHTFEIDNEKEGKND